jgi:hypothetical protein
MFFPYPCHTLQATELHGVGWVWGAILSCSTMGVGLNYALFLCEFNLLLVLVALSWGCM